MRVRILKDFSTLNDVFHAGEVREIDPRKAEGWLSTGLVMQDKSLDGASETKVETQRPTSKSKSRERTK